MEISKKIDTLVNYSIRNNFIEKEDEIYSKNTLMDILNLDDLKVFDKVEINDNISEILDEILDYACETNLIQNNVTERDLLDSKIMGSLLPKPSQVTKKFDEIKTNEGIKAATAWYYDFSNKSNYIRGDRVAKNKRWITPTKYGDLQITINLSKPEKDPKEIAKAKLIKKVSYPKCLLCKENVGYKGSYTHPGRQNHRIIPFDFKGDPWNLQYSPYVYYNEHSIIFSSEHRDMRIDRKNITNLLDFIEQVPHYFVGSNADLPIVGGSILSHDHFQGGYHKFPMEEAEIIHELKFEGFEGVEAGILKWPLSVVRLTGDKEKLIDLGEKILTAWREYSDESLNILAYSENEPHNTITPLARRVDENYQLDLVLRNNRTTDEHPLGLFHPHSELHHIKKENIGLIEVMGLAVLPGRLKSELDSLKEIVLEDNFLELVKNDETLEKHYDWCVIIEKKLKDGKTTFETEVGRVFERVLEDAGVFKLNETGVNGLIKFLNTVK